MSKTATTTVPRQRVRYGIRVVFDNGAVGFLRHGPVVGSGPIVRFNSKRDAEVDLAFIREGLEAGAHASIFKILPGKTRGQV
jgi:hypothetical protein